MDGDGIFHKDRPREVARCFIRHMEFAATREDDTIPDEERLATRPPVNEAFQDQTGTLLS